MSAELRLRLGTIAGEEAFSREVDGVGIIEVRTLTPGGRWRYAEVGRGKDPATIAKMLLDPATESDPQPARVPRTRSTMTVTRTRAQADAPAPAAPLNAEDIRRRARLLDEADALEAQAHALRRQALDPESR